MPIFIPLAVGAYFFEREINRQTDNYVNKYQKTGGEGNAFGHALASADITRYAGSSTAEFLGDLREARPGNNIRSEYMDQHNNAIGRQIGEYARENGLSLSQMQDLIRNAIENGDMITDTGDSRIDDYINDGIAPSDLDFPEWQPPQDWMPPPPEDQVPAPDDLPWNFFPPDMADYGPPPAPPGYVPTDESNPWWFPLITPLIIDIDGDGVELTPLANSTTYFDLDADGAQEHTGWASPDDAFLAYDVNGNGQIDDINELFGNATTDGFSELAMLDSNLDGVIDVSDGAYSSLLLWQDANSNGISETLELRSLSDWGLISINLGAAEVNQTNEGHFVSHTSSVTWSDGTQSAIEDIWFENNQMLTRYVVPPEDAPTIVDYLLPYLEGYGTIKPLVLAMKEDPTLKANVEALLVPLAAGDLKTFMADFESMLLKWAGVDGISPTSQTHIDGRYYAFLEAFHGVPADFGSLGPSEPAGGELLEYFHTIKNGMALRFIIQSPFSSVLTGLIAETDDHPFEFMTALNIGPDADAVTGDFTAIVDAIVSYWQITSADLHVAELVPFLKMLQGDFSQSAQSYIANLQAALATAGLDAVQISDLIALYPQNGVVLTGTSDIDTLRGTAESDLFIASDGDDVYRGNQGDDVYYFNSLIGDQKVVEIVTRGNDKLVFGPDLTIDQLIVERIDSNDAILRFSNQPGSLRLTEQFLQLGQRGVELLEFADGTSLTVNDLQAIYFEQAQTAGNDLIRGFDTNDVIYINSLEGDDEIIEYVQRGNDKIVFGSDLTVGQLSVVNTSGGDAVLRFTGQSGSLRLTDQFIGAQRGVENLEFADGTILSVDDLKVMYFEQAQTSGDDVIFGFDTHDIIYINSLEGDDEIIEYVQRGNDRIVFGPGLLASQLSVINAGGGDAILRFVGQEGSLRITDQFVGFQRGIEFFEFADGTVLTPTDILALVAASGTSGADNITGTVSNDTLLGLAGDDLLSGADGDDVLIGGAGADTLDGGLGFDIASYRTAAAGVDVHMGDTSQNTGDASGDTYVSIEGLEGSSYDDTIIGPSGGGVLYGLEGDDSLVGLEGGSNTLYGGSGNDQLYGNSSNDFLDGGYGDDIVFGYEGDDTLRLGDGDDYAIGGSGYDIIIGGDGADEMHGHEGDDYFEGDLGDDLAFGDEGNDIINLGRGNDYAVGGSGFDTFVFKAGDDQLAISDFDVAEDTLDLSGFGITTMAELAAVMSEWEGTTYMDFSDGSSITLYGVAANTLSDANVQLVA